MPGMMRKPKSRPIDGIKEIANVYEFAKDPMTKVKVRILEIQGKWYFDIRPFREYEDKLTGETKYAIGKGLCLNSEFLPELAESVGAIRRFLEDSTS
jgi:hypothetical protein